MPKLINPQCQNCHFGSLVEVDRFLVNKDGLDDNIPESMMDKSWLFHGLKCDYCETLCFGRYSAVGLVKQNV